MRLHQMESGPAKNALKRPFEGGSTVRPFYSLDIIAQVDHQNLMACGWVTVTTGTTLEVCGTIGEVV